MIRIIHSKIEVTILNGDVNINDKMGQIAPSSIETMMI